MFDKIPKNADNIYFKAESVSLASTDAVPTPSGIGRFWRGLLVSGTGNVAFELIGGGDPVIYPVSASSQAHEIRGYAIAKIIKASTTASIISALS